MMEVLDPVPVNLVIIFVMIGYILSSTRLLAVSLMVEYALRQMTKVDNEAQDEMEIDEVQVSCRRTAFAEEDVATVEQWATLARLTSA